MDIMLKKLDSQWPGTKIGCLIDGANKLTEFDSSLCVEDATGKCEVTFTLAYEEVVAETDIVEPEVAKKSKFKCCHICN